MGSSQVPSELAGAGHIETRKASVVLVTEEGDQWAVERGKARQWLHREQRTWTELLPEAEMAIQQTKDREETGYRTLAWPITQAIAHANQLDTMVGPSVWEMDPTFLHWSMQTTSRPLVMLNAIPHSEQEAVVRDAIQREGWAVLYDDAPSAAVYQILCSAGTSWTLDYKSKPAVYKKEWWQDGNKHLCKGKEVTVWQPTSAQKPPTINPSKRWAVPWLEEVPQGRQDLAEYYHALQCGVYQHMPGRVCWTDGSQRSIPEEGAVAGAGYIDQTGRGICRKVGGRPTAMRAEMAAATMAAQDTPLDEHLTIVTDSMSLLWILRRWQRHDFGFWIDQENHADILKDLLDVLRRRTARTTFIWCKAHAGNPGNELADILAERGCYSKEPKLWEREEQTVIIRHRPAGDSEGDVISWDGWSKRVTKIGAAHVHNLLRDHFAATATAISTVSLVKEGRGRRFLGEAMACTHIPPLAKRDMLQARSFAFPTASVVSRNTRGAQSPECIYCGHAVETFGHFQCECTAFDGARRVAHNTIANVLVDDVGKHHPQGVTFADTTMADIFPDSPADIRLLRPDGLIIDHQRRQVLLLEFTRGMMEETTDQIGREHEKIMKYHQIRLFLMRRFPKYKVAQGTFIMGVLTSIDEARWKAELESVGMPAEETTRTMRRCVRAGLLALHGMANARRAATEALGESRAEGKFTRALHPRQPAEAKQQHATATVAHSNGVRQGANGRISWRRGGKGHHSNHQLRGGRSGGDLQQGSR